MKKIDQFTKTQLSTLKKRVKTLREQVKDVKEGEGNNKLTQVSQQNKHRRPPHPHAHNLRHSQMSFMSCTRTGLISPSCSCACWSL